MSSPNPDDLSVNPINRQVRVIVYCTAVRNGDTGDEIPFLLERRQNTRDPQERDNLSVALACVPKLDQLVQFLREVVRSPFEYKVREALTFSDKTAFLHLNSCIFLAG